MRRLAADVGEVDLAVFRLHAPHCHHEVVKKIVQSTLSGGAFATPFARESASQLLMSLHRSERVSGDQFEEGFLRLVRDLPQMCLDEPRAADTVARFTWRAMTDGVLAPAFVASLAAGAGVSSEARKCAEVLGALKNASVASASLATPASSGTWGIPSAMTDMAALNSHVRVPPVVCLAARVRGAELRGVCVAARVRGAELRGSGAAQVRGIVTNFVRAGGTFDVDDVSSALKELHCDMYHHEVSVHMASRAHVAAHASTRALCDAQFVREVTMSSTAAAVDRCAELLVTLHRDGVVSSASLRHGIRRMLRELRSMTASALGGRPAHAVVIISALVAARCVSVAEVGDAFSAADDDETESTLLAEMYDRLAFA